MKISIANYLQQDAPVAIENRPNGLSEKVTVVSIDRLFIPTDTNEKRNISNYQIERNQACAIVKIGYHIKKKTPPKWGLQANIVHTGPPQARA